ncbi:MAG: Npt1/Npt2 family nucleotide transporter [Candidatus Latescibacterota bacterium]
MAARGGLLQQVMDIRRHEWPMALGMLAYFFLVITVFWILKPLKKGIFIGHYDQSGVDLLGWQLTAAQAELVAKVLNMVVAFAAVAAFTYLSRRLRRQQLTCAFSLFFVLALALYVPVLDRAGPWTVWTFYLLGDLYSTLMVATFFAFLNDSVDARAAKRLYGLIGLGGVGGGWFGSAVLLSQIGTLGRGAWVWVCAGITLLVALIAVAVGRRVGHAGEPRAAGAAPVPPSPEGGSAALEGARLVLRSGYLLAIVAIVGLYEVVSTVMDFQFSAAVAHYLDGEEIGVQFARVYTLTNAVAFCVQLFLTSLVMTRLGVGAALLFLPVAALAGSAAFAVLPSLWIGSLLNTADNGFAYSINQSAKETLYVPTSRDEKYKAKAFIDMFVQRLAKALAVGLSLLITTYFTGFGSIRWLSFFSIAVLIAWVAAARCAGRAFAGREGSH